jgi:hypothetical protein
MELYKAAVFELERSLIAERIAEARAEIVKRVDALRQITGLHDEAQQATTQESGGGSRTVACDSADNRTAQGRGLAIRSRAVYDAKRCESFSSTDFVLVDRLLARRRARNPLSLRNAWYVSSDMEVKMDACSCKNTSSR